MLYLESLFCYGRQHVCTRVFWSDNGVAKVVSRTMDWQVSDDPVLTLPHPRAHERAFVLVPWHDVDPGAEIPGRGRIADLLAAAASSAASGAVPAAASGAGPAAASGAGTGAAAVRRVPGLLRPPS